MKKLDAEDVGVYWVLFLIAVMIFVCIVFQWLAVLTLAAIIMALCMCLIAIPYIFTWAWNKYIATDED